MIKDIMQQREDNPSYVIQTSSRRLLYCFPIIRM